MSLPGTVRAAVRSIVAVLIGLLVSSAAWADEPLTIASEGARPPYNFLDTDGSLAGFEVDLGRELCARTHHACTFVTQDWDGLLPGLLSKQYDAVMAALDITAERRAQVAFSLPYVRIPPVLVLAKSSVLKDVGSGGLTGKTLGVEDGSASQTFLEESYKGSTAKAFASLEDAMLDLAEGKIDGLVADKLSVSDFLTSRREGHCCRIVTDLPRDPAIFGEGIGIAFRKGDIALREAFDRALLAAIEDGTFARIRSKYFSVDIR